MSNRSHLKQLSLRIAPAVAAVLIIGCGDGDGGRIGPCVITYGEPLFSITTARDALTDVAIGQVVLRDFTYDRPPGPRPPLLFLTNHVGLTPTNVTRTATELVCTVRCAFGAAEGGYTFTFGAAGYRDTTLTVVDARFSQSVGSCPQTLSGGVALNLRLTKQ